MSFAGRGRGFGGAGRGSFATAGADFGGFGATANVAPAVNEELWDDAATAKPATVSGFGGGDSTSNGFGSINGFGSKNNGFESSNDGGFGSSNSFSSSTGGSRGRGGFGGSSGSRGGGPRTCHKCGEEGHMSRECPQGGGGGGGPRTCHKCGEEGHMSRECPRGGGGGGPRTCHKCGEEGHMSRECPQGGGGGSRACFKCNQEGHISRDCPNGKGGSAGGFGEMNSGGGFGDSGGFGQSESGGFGGGSRGGFSGGSGGGGGGGGGSGCRNCGEDGHFARECPEPKKGGDGCRNCGESGHFARECPNPRKTEDGRPPTENYVPPDDNDSEDATYKSVQVGINFDKYDKIPVELTGNNPTRPIQSFAEAGLLDTIEANVKKANYFKPTPIQKYAVPAIMAGRDLMGCAQTGSGKTAAFLLPALTGMIQKGLESGSFSALQEPQALVVAPTRELVIQIYNECRKFSNGTIVRCVRLYGGTSTMHQSSDLAKGANIIIATPGRLLDFVGRQKIGLGKLQYLILDEADRMLDMGFEPDMRRLIETMGMPPKTARQTLMFSATFPTEIQRLAGDFLNDYLFLTVGVVGGANQDVTQSVVEVTQYEKRDKLIEILRENPNRRSLIFVEQKRNADFLASMLSQSELSTTSIHGDRLQREREQALQDFKYGRAPILVATSVAARGLDIPGVDQVINYDLPKEIDEYVHRIGRTGRCGNLGIAISFFDAENNCDMARHLVRCLAAAHQEVPDFLERAASGGGMSGGGGGNFGGRDNRSRGLGDGGGDTGGWDERPGGVPLPDDDAQWD